MNLENINYITEEKLPEVKTLIIGISLFLGAFVLVDNFINQFISLEVKAVIYTVLILSWISFWTFKKFRLPRSKKEEVGIVISIFSENEKERQRLKADFIGKLKKDFQQEGILNFSEIIFLKNHFSKQIIESNNPKGILEKFNKKIKAHFYVWGDVKKRTDGDEGEKYFLNFQGYVVHKPISQNLSQEISRDFSKVLPSEVNFLEKRSFRGFEASAKIVHLATKYIIGVAAFVSNDPRLALQLHNGLKEQFNTFKPLPPHIQEIRNRIPILISDELFWIAKWYFENNNIEKTKEFIQKSIDENNNNYGAWLLKAMIDFSVDNNIDEALKSTKKARGYTKNSYEWRYNEAFLYFWKEDYTNALRLCQKIKKQNYLTEEVTVKEVRKFNLNILQNNPSKHQLYFWIGYLSWFKEKNIVNALQDFEKFEELADTNMDILKQKSSAYLIEIRQKMKIGIKNK
ncbi:MAG TPA: hypothetical protein ENI56_00665 [Candidatus Kaiserbacteria bacterium]|nr:hypothetical protein [Candidatus Kaiserbacteria bacterium]